jgi:hypothetical protein
MSDLVDQGRRRLLTVATAGVGAIGVAFAAVPFLASWQPSARAKALGAPVDVDASKLEAGQMLKVVWRGQPVFVIRRTKAVIDGLSGHDALLADPKSLDSQQPGYIESTGAVRAVNPEYPFGLLAARRLRAQQPFAGDRHRSGCRLAGWILLSVSWVEVRHLGPRLQEHAGAEEPDHSFLYDYG